MFLATEFKRLERGCFGRTALMLLIRSVWRYSSPWRAGIYCKPPLGMLLPRIGGLDRDKQNKRSRAALRNYTVTRSDPYDPSGIRSIRVQAVP